MCATLTRTYQGPNGIFGTLEISGRMFYTLEHAYKDPTLLTYSAKIPVGTHSCERGMHRLSGMAKPFETFQILVEGHTDILFHTGNINQDSSGCVLLGVGLEFDSRRDPIMLLKSRTAFANFLTCVPDVEKFILEVKNT